MCSWVVFKPNVPSHYTTPAESSCVRRADPFVGDGTGIAMDQLVLRSRSPSLGRARPGPPPSAPNIPKRTMPRCLAVPPQHLLRVTPQSAENPQKTHEPRTEKKLRDGTPLPGLRTSDTCEGTRCGHTHPLSGTLTAGAATRRRFSSPLFAAQRIALLHRDVVGSPTPKGLSLSECDVEPIRLDQHECAAASTRFPLGQLCGFGVC